MGKGKKAGAQTAWKLAGTRIVPSALTREEETLLYNCFYIYKTEHFRAMCRERPHDWITVSSGKRHETAARAVLGYLCDHFSGRYSRATVAHNLFEAAAIPVATTARYTGDPSFLLGAAIWLLDYMEHHDRRTAFFAALPPSPPNDLWDIIPYVGDFSHSDEDILRVTAVLMGREKLFRKEYRAILELVDRDCVAELKVAFRDALLSYFELLLKADAGAPRHPQEAGGPLAPRMVQTPTLQDMLNAPGPFDPYLEDRGLSLMFLLATTDRIGRPNAGGGLAEQQIDALLSDFGTEDPYALCAAYLFLERSDDLLASLNTLTGAVMACAERHLPWSQGEAMEDVPRSEPKLWEHRLCHPLTGDVAEWVRECQGDEDESATQLASETQLFFLATGYVPPRRSPSGKLVRLLKKQGLSLGKARETALCALLANCVDAKAVREMYREFDAQEEAADDADGAEANAEGDEKPEETGAAEKPPSADDPALIKQVKELRRALHDADHTAAAQREQLEKAEAQTQADKDELAQLREALFRMKEGETVEALPETPSVELPWQVSRKVSVFGGHESWSKAVRPLLPGARFYDKETLPDLDAIRASDVIWIQANALSHKYYYRIINTARTYSISVRYFGYASARKCAEQLALDEQAVSR